MDTSTVIRPKLKHSSVFLRTEDGVFLQSDKVAFRIKGNSIARWISALGPYMNGKHTLDELCKGFEPAQREMLIHLVETLLQRGVLKDEFPESPETLPTSVRCQFAEQIAYIDHFVDQPEKRFKAFRESRILLVGSGESLIALALSLMRNGLRELFLATADGSDRYNQALEAEVASVRQGGSDVRLSSGDVHSQNGFERLEDYDIIVYCSDNSSLQEIARLNQRCVRAGRPFLSATIFAGQAMLGPFTRGGDDPCWLCAQLRLSAQRESDTSAAFWKELALGNDLSSGNGGLFNPIARRIGHGLGFELFKILSGALPSETENGVVLQDLENLGTSSNRLTQHPLCPVCTHNDPDLTTQQLLEIVHEKHDHELTQQEIRTKHDGLFNPSMGVFREFVDEYMQQIPLKGTRITMKPPMPSLCKNLSMTSYAIADVRSAYIPAFTEAIRNYTRVLPDLRSMLSASSQEMIERGHIVVQPQQLTTWSGGLSLNASTPIEWLPAFSWLKQSLVFVPAAAVYPHTPLNRLGMFARTSAGSAVATTFRATLTAGLLSALGYIHLQELIRGHATVAQLDLDVLSSAGTDLAYLVKSAQRFERSFTCSEVIHTSPLSVVIVRTTDASGEHLTTFGIGLSGLEAATMALLDFVGGLQAFQELQSEGTPPATIDKLCPGFSQDSDLAYAPPDASRFTSSAIPIKYIEDYLQGMGKDMLFVNITPSDIWNAKALISGTVLLTLTQSEQESQQSIELSGLNRRVVKVFTGNGGENC